MPLAVKFLGPLVQLLLSLLRLVAGSTHLLQALPVGRRPGMVVADAQHIAEIQVAMQAHASQYVWCGGIHNRVCSCCRSGVSMLHMLMLENLSSAPRSRDGIGTRTGTCRRPCCAKLKCWAHCMRGQSAAALCRYRRLYMRLSLYTFMNVLWSEHSKV